VIQVVLRTTAKSQKKKRGVAPEATPPPSTNPDTLSRALYRNHPSAFENWPSSELDVSAPQTGIPFAPLRSDNSEVSPMAGADDESPVVDLAETASRDLAGFAKGEWAITQMAALTCSPPERGVFQEVLRLRSALMSEQSVGDVRAAMLVDTAVVALFNSRRYAMMAAAVLSEGLTAEKTRVADKLDKMADRAHRRFVSALDTLMRTRRFPINVHVEKIANLCTGDQRIAGGADT